MILRRPTLLPLHFVILLCLIPLVPAQNDSSNFDCHITIDNLKYDLTSLAGEHSVSRERDTPPSTMVDSVRFDMCADLKASDGVPEGDQVRNGTLHRPNMFQIEFVPSVPPAREHASRKRIRSRVVTTV